MDKEQNQTILIIDDQENFADMIAESLKYIIDCRIVTASNGLEAIEKFNEFHPSVLITDYHLPGYNGMEIIEKTKTFAEQKGFLPSYIMLTGDKLSNLPKMKLFEYQVQVFVKPFEIKNLIACIVSAYSQSEVDGLIEEGLM